MVVLNQEAKGADNAMATGEAFMRICWARQNANQPKLIVDKNTNQKIDTQIKALQGEYTELSNNDDLSDEEFNQQGKAIHEKINQLIASKYRQ
jgi:hypothetical protein